MASLIFYGGEGFRFRAALIWGLAIVGLNLIWQNKVRSPWMISVIQPMTLEFIGGMLLAYFFRKGVGRISPRTAALATLLSVATVIAWASHHGSYFFARDPLTRPLFYGGPALVVVWMALQMDLQGQWRGLAALASAGDRSYTTYLIHFPLIAAVYHVAAPHYARTGHFAIPLVALTVVPILAISVECFYRLVEEPLRELARRASKRVASLMASPRAVPAGAGRGNQIAKDSP